MRKATEALDGDGGESTSKEVTLTAKEFIVAETDL
jgi:hypothetical protein